MVSVASLTSQTLAVCNVPDKLTNTRQALFGTVGILSDSGAGDMVTFPGD